MADIKANKNLPRNIGSGSFFYFLSLKFCQYIQQKKADSTIHSYFLFPAGCLSTTFVSRFPQSYNIMFLVQTEICQRRRLLHSSSFCKLSPQPVTMQDSISLRRLISVTLKYFFVSRDKSPKKNRPIYEHIQTIFVG